MITRIRLNRDRGSQGRVTPANATTPAAAAFTFIEVLAATLVLGVVAVSIYFGLAAGDSEIKATREDLRATQIMLQKLEAIRLFTWSQVTDPTNYLTSNFTEDYDPLS